MTGASPLPFQNGGNEAEVPYHNSIVGNIIVYQDRIETNLLQLFAHPENLEWFSINSRTTFEVNNMVDEQKQANW